MNAERAMQEYGMSSGSSIKPFDLSRSVNEAREVQTQYRFMRDLLNCMQSLRNLQRQTAEDSTNGQDDGPLEEV